MLNPFVSKPFLKCPKCAENFFGVSSIGDNFYTRRCAQCGYPPPNEKSEIFFLPELNKKVIYLDQFVISNMVKALDPEAGKNVDPFYLEAFKKLDTLSKFQLVVCPDSEFHEDESIFSQYPKEHKRVYELLSHGVSYWDRWTILRFQISEHLDNWLKNSQKKDTSFSVHKFTYGKINAWQDRLLITVDSKRAEMAKEDLRNTKSSTFEIFKKALARWESEKGKNYEYWYREELAE